MKKFLLPFFAVFLACLICLYAARGWISKVFFETFITALTGFDTNIRGVTVDLGKGVFSLNHLTILNPDGFEKRVFADIPEIFIRFNLASVLEAKKLHIDLLRLNIRELNIEIRGDGKSNLALLKTDGKKESPPDSGGASGQSVFSPGGEEGKSPFYIRKFVLTLRKVNYRDKSNLVPISITDDVRLEDAVFFGLDQPGEIPDLIVLNLLAQTKFGDLGLDPAEIGRAVRATAQAAAGPGEETPEGDDLKDAVETVKDEFSAFWDEVKAKFRKNGKTPAEGSDPGKG